MKRHSRERSPSFRVACTWVWQPVYSLFVLGCDSYLVYNMTFLVFGEGHRCSPPRRPAGTRAGGTVPHGERGKEKEINGGEFIFLIGCSERDVIRGVIFFVVVFFFFFLPGSESGSFEPRCCGVAVTPPSPPLLFPPPSSPPPPPPPPPPRSSTPTLPPRCTRCHSSQVAHSLLSPSSPSLLTSRLRTSTPPPSRSLLRS